MSESQVLVQVTCSFPVVHCSYANWLHRRKRGPHISKTKASSLEPGCSWASVPLSPSLREQRIILQEMQGVSTFPQQQPARISATDPYNLFKLLLGKTHPARGTGAGLSPQPAAKHPPGAEPPFPAIPPVRDTAATVPPLSHPGRPWHQPLRRRGQTASTPPRPGEGRERGWRDGAYPPPRWSRPASLRKNSPQHPCAQQFPIASWAPHRFLRRAQFRPTITHKRPSDGRKHGTQRLMVAAQRRTPHARTLAPPRGEQPGPPLPKRRESRAARSRTRC